MHLMVVAYFSNKNNIVSRLGYSRVGIVSRKLKE
jgi:hypothetical protein